MADLLDEAGVKPVLQDNRPRCPQCREPMASNAILCVNCGFNVETGKRIQGLVSAQGAANDLYGLKDEGGHGSAAKSVLRKAERTIQEDKVEEYRIRTQGTPIWALAIMFGCLATFGACMSMLPTSKALLITGITLATLPGMVAVICNIMILVVAFSESIREGVCVLLIPFYNIYYSWTRWDKCGRFFMIALICGFLSGAGGGLAAWSPRFATTEDGPMSPK